MAHARIVPRSSQWYGWVPDLPDHRDRMFQAPLARIGRLPPRVDLRGDCPPVYDQGRLGSCTANAIAGALEFNQIKQGLTDVFPPSRLFIYYNERVMEGTVDEDSGAMIRDGIKSVAKGAPHEVLWLYAVGKFRTKPVKPAFADARKHPAVLYQRVSQDLQQSRLAVTRCSRSATSTRRNASSSATRGARRGPGGLLHDAVRLPAQRRSERRLLDDFARGVEGPGVACYTLKFPRAWWV